jgi:hypothetical protein
VKDKHWIGITLCALTALAYQTWRVEQLQFETRLLRDAQRIDASQIRELMFMADTANRAVEGEKTRAFLAGVTQAQLDPQLREVWHAGYDRGVEVTSDGNVAGEKAKFVKTGE